MSEYVETDFVLDVVCEHTRNVLPEATAPRVVSRIYYLPRPPGRVGFIEWRESPLEDYPGALQTWVGEALRRGDDLRTSWGPMDGAQRWRFWCKDCDDTLPVRHDLLETALDLLRRNGVSRISMRALAGTLSK